MDRKFLNEKWKQLNLMFAFGILSGCIYFNILWRVQGSLFQNEWGMILDQMNAYTLSNLYSLILRQAYMIWIFYLCVWILGFFKIGKIIVQGIVICTGFFTGVGETLLLLELNIKDGTEFFLKFAVILGIHALFLGITFVAANGMSALKWISREKTKKWRQIQVKKYCMIVAISLFLHIVYVFICSYVNNGKISLKFFCV